MSGTDEAARRELLELLLAEEGSLAGSAPTPPLRPRADPAQPAPLSAAQQRLWFLEQFAPGEAAYHVPGVLGLTGPLSAAAFRAALLWLIDRHEVLRTVFTDTPGGPVQRVQPARLDWAEADGRREGAGERAARLHADAVRPFHLERGPLVRALLLRVGEAEHWLALTLHHLVADQWSLAILTDELAQGYRAALRQSAPDLPPLPLQYADFASWQRSWERGPDCQAQLAWWGRQLAGLQPMEFPIDFPREARAGSAGATERFVLPGSARTALEHLGRAEGATLFMTLLAVFLVQLHRSAGTRDLAVGTPVSGRSRAETAPLIGFFTNTLVIRLAVDGEPTFRQWLRAVRQACIEAYARQDVPFELLVEKLSPPRELDRNPWFDALFVLQEPHPIPALPEVQAAYLPVDVAAAKFDLTLTTRPEADGSLTAWWEYRTALLSPARMKRMAEQFVALATGAGAAPDRQLLALPMLGAAEAEAINERFNATARNFTGSPLVHRRFEEQLAGTPDAAAVADGSERLTYAELERRANRLARRLQRHGIGPDQIVGLCLGRTVDLVVGVLGVLKAGGCYLPLDPNYPADRVDYMLEDAAARVLVVHSATRGRFEARTGRALLDLEADGDALASELPTRPECAARGGHLAYIIYTSGSTGRPKGVTLSYGALDNLIRWHLATLLGGVKTLLFASLSFDASFHEMFAALGSGGELWIAGENARRDTAALVTLLGRERIAKAVLPVVVLQQIAAEHAEQAAQLADLRELTTTGEALVITPPMIELFRRLPNCTLHNHYGPSETHVVTAYAFPGPPDRLRPPPPIGRPVANTQVRILDRRGQPCGIGIPGELFLGGANLGRDYHRRPDLTADRFVPDPWPLRPGARLYRTGDLARWLEDGTIEFLGRVDEQVKIRGFRVEPGEIETLLARHPAVAAAAVALCERSPGDKLLVGYVVRRAGTELEIAGLRAFLGGQLPDYMVPSAFVELAALPLTPSGKVERRSLPAPAADRLARDAAFVPPVTPAEILGAEIWAELLGLARVGLEDNFFHLGGHSLLAARLVARIRARTTLELPLRAVFEHPTLRGCVAALAAVAGDRATLEAVAETVRETEAEV